MEGMESPVSGQSRDEGRETSEEYIDEQIRLRKNKEMLEGDAKFAAKKGFHEQVPGFEQDAADVEALRKARQRDRIGVATAEDRKVLEAEKQRESIAREEEYEKYGDEGEPDIIEEDDENGEEQ